MLVKRIRGVARAAAQWGIFGNEAKQRVTGEHKVVQHTPATTEPTADKAADTKAVAPPTNELSSDMSQRIDAAHNRLKQQHPPIQD